MGPYPHPSDWATAGLDTLLIKALDIDAHVMVPSRAPDTLISKVLDIVSCAMVFDAAFPLHLHNLVGINRPIRSAVSPCGTASSHALDAMSHGIGTVRLDMSWGAMLGYSQFERRRPHGPPTETSSLEPRHGACS